MKSLTLKNEKKISNEIKKDIGEIINKIELKKPRRIFLETSRKNLKKVLNYLKDKMDCHHLSAITGLDNLKEFGLIYHLWSNKETMISTKIKISGNKPEMETVTDIFPVANLFEREIHDLFGIEFLGHPDLRRLMLNEDWPKNEHPLRKDWIKNEKKYYGGIKR
jgi:NADH-quinone oxidoreductase subunit C